MAQLVVLELGGHGTAACSSGGGAARTREPDDLSTGAAPHCLDWSCTSLLVRMLLELEEGEGGNEWVTCGPHMSLRCRPTSYVAVNTSVAWSKPLNVGQNSLAPAQVLKVNGFDSWGTSTRRFCS